ncbi:MAG: sulfurtransferase TusA family protein [Dehalococcoidales bacterium]|nr:sulfurtransferase TusA family protein [Dehalococcoidales bacterium]
MIQECDLCGFICPISKIKACQAIDCLDEGDTVRIILGDTESLKNIVQELKSRGLTPDFTAESDSKFILTVSK